MDRRRAGGSRRKGAPVLEQVFRRRDLASLSLSSVGPLFSIAATGGVMAADAGWWTLPAIGVIAVPFLMSAFVFRFLNQHFPHAGASYHWSARVLGPRPSRFQAWVLILAYFLSIPPIIIPAATYTLALVAPHVRPNALLELGVGGFWVLFALVPLLGGGRPTARITQGFLVVELVSMLGLAVVGIARWHALHVPVHFGPVPVGGLFVTVVIAATILDGWEIDSYAAEESRRPRSDPGSAGIIGAFLALGIYAVLYPLILSETPLKVLSGSTDPLAIWGARLLPGAPAAILIPVLASTAGGLWLTSFILTRALYAMGREGVLPKALGSVSRRRVPHVAIVVALAAAFGVTALQLTATSLTGFFSVLLGAAGFFLMLEFFLDSMTATVFLARMHWATEAGVSLPHEHVPHGHRSHSHAVLQVGSALSTALFGVVLVGFVFEAPHVVGSSLDVVAGVLLVGGVVFAFGSRRGVRAPFVFAGQDLAAGQDQKAPGSGGGCEQAPSRASHRGRDDTSFLDTASPSVARPRQQE